MQGGAIVEREAEQQIVAGLAADGLGDREIAEALRVSHGTVERRLTSALGKLGVRSRAELAEALG